MRIQHNIMAMSAYRNYTNNVSAMKKNLEKLSSGYKINRAGDDAAGLAISEKMRAQITGLETAQKNAKDGISLVQTAEGALTEVHDMLNRMVELASMSANGTYDNTTDRKQLQKEMEQLNAEIDRIADSANFNGINLLDGSLSGREASSVDKVTTEYGDLTHFTVADSQLPAEGTTQLTNTVLHVDPTNNDHGTELSVDLHNVGFTNKAGDTLTLKVGGTTITVAGTGGKALSGSELVNYIVSEVNKGSSTVQFNSGSAAAANTDGEFVMKSGSVTSTFTLAAGGAGDDRLVFTQKDAPVTTSQVFDGYGTVTITGAFRADSIKDSFTTSGGAASATTATFQITNGTSTAATWTNATDKLIADNIKADFKAELNLADQGGTITVTLADLGLTASTGTATLKDADGKEITTTDFMKMVQSAMNKKIGELNAKNEADALAATTAYSGGTYNKVAQVAIVAADMGKTTAADLATKPNVQAMKYAAKDGTTVDYQMKTTDVKNVTMDNTPRLASTKFTLTAEMAADGNSVKIGDENYVFTANEALKGKSGYVYVGDLGTKGANLTADDAIKAAKRLQTAAAGNTTYTVGNDGTSADIMVTEIEGQTNYNLKTVAGIEESLGYQTVTTKVETIVTEATKKLTLQIGDTADPWNQLSVSIDDTHAAALGLDAISIADQDSAAKAVDVIKEAINKVSDIRGTLGATQNRLDHTINNLSVMTENIQDAESTIRDVDVAEEMMAYTKNNILIQSAQAMLAQANQVPQGVLQLLQ